MRNNSEREKKVWVSKCPVCGRVEYGDGYVPEELYTCKCGANMKNIGVFPLSEAEEMVKNSPC